MGVLDAGELDRRVTLSHAVIAKNPTNGERTETFSVFATVYAKRMDLHGTKRLIAQQVTSQQQIEYTIRFRTDVLRSDRLIDADAGLTFEILDSAQLGRREGLCLLCRAVVP